MLQNNARPSTIGNLIDRAMDAIERDNPSLKGVLPHDYRGAYLNWRRLGELIDIAKEMRGANRRGAGTE